MTEEQAKARCSELATTHPDRATHQWLPQRIGDGWQVAKIGLPPPADPLVAETRADERPSTGDDPRTAQQINVPWPGA